jgi:hypothetical protein
MSRVSLHRGHGLVDCSRAACYCSVATVAHIGLGFHNLYIRRDYVIIRGRQDKSYLRIGSLPLGCGCRHRRGCGSGVIYQGS